MLGHSLEAVTGRGDSFAAAALLKNALVSGAEVFPDHPIGWQGGGGRLTAYWLAKVGGSPSRVCAERETGPEASLLELLWARKAGLRSDVGDHG
jgi:hypothetical protein